MELHQIGINVKHAGNFCIDRPNGSPDYLFLIYQTGASVLVNDKQENVLPNSCILYKKNHRQLYASNTESYMDTYIHFDCNDEEIKELDLVFNKPFYLKNTIEIMDIMKFISKEQISFSKNKSQNENLLISYLLSKIQDNITDQTLTLEKSRNTQKLIEIRAEMYSNAGKYNTVAELAESANLSLSHFKFLYKQYFEISCYSDMLTAKTLLAEHYLRNSDLSIKEIASLCGYENDTCFMRRFKNLTGITPSDFRNNRLKI